MGYPRSKLRRALAQKYLCCCQVFVWDKTYFPCGSQYSGCLLSTRRSCWQGPSNTALSSRYSEACTDPSNATDHVLLWVLPQLQRPCAQCSHCHISAPPRVTEPLVVMCWAQKVWPPDDSDSLSGCMAVSPGCSSHAPGPWECLANAWLSTLVLQTSAHLHRCSRQLPKYTDRKTLLAELKVWKVLRRGTRHSDSPFMPKKPIRNI